MQNVVCIGRRRKGEGERERIVYKIDEIFEFVYCTDVAPMNIMNVMYWWMMMYICSVEWCEYILHHIGLNGPYDFIVPSEQMMTAIDNNCDG